jgi:hypothetical protein
MQGQSEVIAALGKHLDNKYVLLRNPILPGSQDVRLPMVLSGPPGVFLLNVTSVRGMFRAKGEEWGTITSDHFKAIRPNLVMLTARYSQGLQKFLERQGVMSMLTVEPILLATNPGAHVDTVRPLVRVVMSDALERFAVSITQARALLSPEDAQVIIDRVITPKVIKKEAPAPVVPAEERQTPMYDPNDRFKEESPAPVAETGSGAFGSSFEAEAEPNPVVPVVKPAAAPVKKKASKPQKNINLTNKQLAIIAGVFAFLVFCLIGLIAIAFYMNAG